MSKSIAERIEALEGGSRAVDWEIHCRNGLDGVGGYGAHPHYTASLDAAMTLVPGGWAVGTLTWWPPTPDGAANSHDGKSRVALWQQSMASYGALRIWGHGGGDNKVEGNSSTPALALCAAALRAQEATNG